MPEPPLVIPSRSERPLVIPRTRCEELNILILGEKGVGKSTWINAFTNYLSFETLDEALAAKDLNCAIPSEDDPVTGQTGTQRTSVYYAAMRSVLVRLIDTPGIGNTNGVYEDGKNVEDILKALRCYNDLHGILILLKPDTLHLGARFRYVAKGLLTLLHKDAAANIVFGFTNTQGSNYTPGDTFKPLQKLVAECTGINMGLFENNVYCFDSEGFRYLAAQKQGVDMGHLEGNRRSWKHSAAACMRLVTYLEGIRPHKVQSTITLNETRNMIVKLGAVTPTLSIMPERYRHERNQVEALVRQLGSFLKSNAIMPYNDAGSEYLDMLVDQEKILLQCSERKQEVLHSISALEKNRAADIRRVEILKSAMDNGDKSKLLDDAGIRQAMDSVSALPFVSKALLSLGFLP